MALFHTTVVDNQIKALDTIGTASGSIATFDTDRAERLVSCVCEVASGNSEINVTACGKNLFDINALTATGITISGNSAVGSATNFLAFGSGININIPKTTVLTLSVTGYTEANQGTNGAGIRFRVKYTDNTETVLTFLNTVTSALRQSITTESGKTISYIYIDYGSNGNNIWHLSDIQIELGTATTYEEYNGTKLNIPFGETLSGNGSFDVLSGILTRSDDTTKQLNANYIQANSGTNNIYADTGDIIDLKFILSVGKAIS